MSDQALREKRIEKLSALFAKAERAGTDEEAATFLAGAQRLMKEWEIEEAELRLASTAPSWDIKMHYQTLSSSSWRADGHGMAMIAEFFSLKLGVRPYRSGYPAQAVGVGTLEDWERFQLFYAQLEMQCIRSMKAAERTVWGDKRKWRESFKIGFYRTIQRRLREMKKNEPTGYALVLASKEVAVRDRAAEVFSRSRSTGRSLDANGLSAGGRAGAQADVGQKQVK
jgi:hypothetical protein